MGMGRTADIFENEQFDNNASPLPAAVVCRKK
jgi:hypothetical protein